MFFSFIFILDGQVNRNRVELNLKERRDSRKNTDSLLRSEKHFPTQAKHCLKIN